ncbi:expressed hypothetical protein [Trichoplax adhaerens]|uniref:Zinc finger ZPR1-type domain-containing protein n=1 Tax=Trichoplax adhaerens TaxID=10228 RepID=B3RTP6_TRIAD|nr:expressed hypothetical protein [Trichoplax adhaerens]EDV25665.1 expressed hypothetical protein [Trichoplax adhaerens]|eukprot:XP_002111698.1 expressed hypothetical protein [Trichoplax adhaerens]
MADNQPSSNKPLFRQIEPDDDSPEISEIESLCMNCHENGTTRMMLTKIPMFREIIIMSFRCPHCYMENNEVQFGGKFEEQGCRYTLRVKDAKDLNRQIIKSDWCVAKIPQLDFEIPALPGQSAVLTTIEGLLQRTIDGLKILQPERRIAEPEVAAKIDEFIARIEKYLYGDEEFSLVLEDPAGNSFIENPYFPDHDTSMIVENYVRTKQDNLSLGLQVIVFATNCPSCLTPSQTRMVPVQIPHFKEVIIMALTCEACGFKTNEVKSGAGMSEKGIRLTLNITSPQDMSRDVLKSETCTIVLPAFPFEWHTGVSGGKFTTVEGLLTNLKEELERLNPLGLGDSSDGVNKMHQIVSFVDAIITGKEKTVLILDDPAGNSFIQSDCLPDPDPNLLIEHYQRTDEQDDELGIKDMCVENYEILGEKENDEDAE